MCKRISKCQLSYLHQIHYYYYDYLKIGHAHTHTGMPTHTYTHTHTHTQISERKRERDTIYDFSKQEKNDRIGLFSFCACPMPSSQ